MSSRGIRFILKNVKIIDYSNLLYRQSKYFNGLIFFTGKLENHIISVIYYYYGHRNLYPVIMSETTEIGAHYLH